MNKLVNIYPSRPIIELNPPVRCIITRVLVPEEYIKVCINSGAIVEEITRTGKKVLLNNYNYNKDNSIEQPIVVEEPKASVEKKEDIKVEEKITEMDKKIENKKYSNKKNKYKQSFNNTSSSTISHDTKEKITEETSDSVLDIENLDK
jgi:hypothetical protein